VLEVEINEQSFFFTAIIVFTLAISLNEIQIVEAAHSPVTVNTTAVEDSFLVDQDFSDDCTVTLGNIAAGNFLIDFMFVGLEDLPAATDCWRGFYDFFIDNSTATGIQDDDDVTDLTLFVTQAFSGGLLDCDIRHINGTGIVPLTTNGTDAQLFELWENMGNGTEFVSDDTFCNAGADVNTSVVLGEAAELQLEQALLETDPFLENLFAISILAGNETLIATDKITFLYTKNESTDPKRLPVLQMTYTTTHHFAAVNDTLGIEDTFAEPTFARFLTFFPEAGSLGSRDAPFALSDDGTNDLCDQTDQPSGTGATLTFGWWRISSINDCNLAVILWDIDPIPNNAVILNVTTVLKGRSTSEGIQLIQNECQFKHMETYPPLLGDELKGDDVLDGETYLTDPLCSTKLGFQILFPTVETVEPPVRFDLGNATGEVQDRLGKGSSTACTNCRGNDWFAVGLDFDQTTKNGTLTERQVVSGDSGQRAELEVRFLSPTDIITDLVATGHIVDVDLDWTTPRLYGYNNITGYQINFTSPQGNPPLTIIINDTGSTTTDALISGLEAGANFSFRIKAWDTEILETELSNIADVSTRILGNFTIGTLGNTTEFSLNLTQADARDIKYTRIDASDTQTILEVVHPNSFNLQCDMYFKLALSNQTFTGLTTVPEGATEKKATFTFNNQQRDIIEVTCFDTATNVTADYLITQTNFLLLDQFANFRDGTYGTSGQFGSIDLITLGAVIIAMIGFNRVNETVGAIFAVVILGGLTFFEIVVWQTFMFGTMAAVIMLVIASTRKQ